MKASHYVEFPVLILIVSCSKVLESKGPEYPMKVFEYHTTSPVPDVRVDMYHCTDRDLYGECINPELYATGYTNKNGEYIFSSSNFNRANEGIVLTKAKYWEGSGGEGDRFIVPEGWLDLRMIRKNTYPDTSDVLLTMYGETGFGGSFYFRAPADSVIKIRGFGNQTNNVYWTISHEVSLPWICFFPVCGPFASDTLANGVITKVLNKAGSTSFTLEY